MAFKKRTEIVDLEGAKELLDDAERALSGDPRVERFYAEIKNTLEKLKHDIDRLRKAKPKEGISDALRIRGVPNRDVMVSNLNAVQKISVPREKDYRSVMSFYREASSALEVPFGKLSYNIRFVRAVFPEEFSAVVSDVKRLRSLLNYLVAPARKKEDTIRAIDHSREVIEEIEALLSSESSGGVEESVEDLEKRLGNERERIKQLKSSEQWMRYETSERDLSQESDELQRKEAGLDSVLSPIRKTLSLLKKEDETGKRTLLPEEREAVNALLLSPLKTILEGNVKEQLLLVNRALEGDTIINAERRERALRDLEAILSFDFSSGVKEVERLRKEVEKTEQKVAGMKIRGEVERAERNVEDLERGLKRAHEDRERSERHRASTDAALSEKLEELSDALSRMEKRRIEVSIQERS